MSSTVNCLLFHRLFYRYEGLRLLIFSQGVPSHSSSTFGSSLSCAFLFFVSSFISIFFPRIVFPFLCLLPTVLPCIADLVSVFSCSRVLTPRPCIALANSSRSFSWTRALHTSHTGPCVMSHTYLPFHSVTADMSLSRRMHSRRRDFPCRTQCRHLCIDVLRAF
ncbi:hypothetical protein ARMGADRAFT_138122 [Armillaria gallica]|uniref:Transmembrane protein n=1 Tax=Armillaria gallica TaxID=47427 RepID=A0A2H3DC60_ARMGA|nr:hypothetical protein ARMGADRAFT_138122 [Armillaria gallica]